MTPDPENARTVLPTLHAIRFSPWIVLTFPNVITALFLGVCGTFILHHGLWRDEAVAFLIARDSRSLADLFENLRYEGHPPLWYLLLYAITRFTVRPEVMQAFHLILAATSVYVVTRFAPFPRIAKVLFPFGYFTLFEYGVLSRNYQLLLLLSVLFCVLWASGRRPYVAFGCILALLCFSHVLGVILAAGFGTLIVFELAATPGRKPSLRALGGPFVCGAGIALLGAALAIQLLIPPPDSGFAIDWHFDLQLNHLLNTLSAFADAYFPVPALQMHFWNKNILGIPAAAVCGTITAILALVAVHRSKPAMVFLLFVDVGIAVFLHTKIFSGWRHAGPIFIALLVSSWFVLNDPDVDGSSSLQRVRHRRILSTALTSIFAVQTCGLIVACYFLCQFPFSPARDAAAFIRPRLTSQDLLVARDDLSICSLSAYLPGRVFFFQRGSRWGTFTLFRSDFSKHNSLWWADFFSRMTHRRVVLIMNEPLGPLPPRMSYAGGFDGGIQADERYYFYFLSAPAAAAAR